MIDCDNGLPPIFVIQPHETEQLAAARCSASWGRKRVDSASCRRGNAVFPVRRKPPMWVRGNFHAPTSPRHYARRRVSERNRRKAAALSAEMSAQHPQGCISAPLVPKGIIRLLPPRRVFSNTPVLPYSLRCDTRSPCLRPPSWFSAPARCFP